MLKFDSFYFQCPHCEAWLEGRNLKAEMVNQAILYSDGKVLNDNYITTPQKMILCPSCGHVFWIEHPVEPLITYEKPDSIHGTLGAFSASVFQTTRASWP